MSDAMIHFGDGHKQKPCFDVGPPLICDRDGLPFQIAKGEAELYLRSSTGQYFLSQVKDGEAIFPAASPNAHFVLIVRKPLTLEQVEDRDGEDAVAQWKSLVTSSLGETIDPEMSLSIADFNQALEQALTTGAMQRDAEELERLRRTRAVVDTVHESDIAATQPLSEAIHNCAKALDVHSDSPPSFRNGHEFDDAPAVARQFGLSSRSVTLTGDWYEHDQGPLLLQFAETGAVANAIWIKGCYQTAGGWPIDTDNKTDFNQHAYILSAPLPEDVTGFWALAKFVIRGNLDEFRSIALAATLVGFLGIITPLATGWILSDLAPAGEMALLIGVGAGLVLAALVTFALSAIRAIAVSRIQGKTGSRLATALFDRLLRLPTSFFREYTAGDLNQRLSGIDGMRSLILSIALSAGLSVVFSIFYFFVLAFYDLRLAFISVLLITVYILIVVVTRALQMPLVREALALDGNLAEVSFEMISAVAKLRTAAAEDRALSRWADLYGQERDLERRAGIITGYSAATSDSWQTLTQVILFGSVAILAKDALEPGMFIAFLVAFGSFQGAFVSLSSQLIELYAAQPQIDRALPILQAPVELSVNKADPGILQGGISVKDVTFAYGEGLAPVLSGISLDIDVGAHVAIVGGSGSGKSTLLRLLLGFETPGKGSIFYDDQNLVELDTARVRSQIGVVMQSSSLFAGSIIDNIRGAHDAGLEQCMAAAASAGLASDLDYFPMGIHTPITEGAAVLSGGQRQRILIARSLVSQPNLLFFDEATSALDNASQAQIAATLDALAVTRITIAHRLSTIENANKVFVLEKGKIAEQGSYEELMAMDGSFASLAKRQLMEE
ncbi:ATP-binding cassette domain-containing protein [Sphingorhabdus sp. Alg231-15]|uniref:ATP-binding cassette domain-containing protein n=1 Tax=Sphingorhabdus sp. Alg231-15 TaxID=1922222 RepID=UPI00307B640D